VKLPGVRNTEGESNLANRSKRYVRSFQLSYTSTYSNCMSPRGLYFFVRSPITISKSLWLHCQSICIQCACRMAVSNLNTYCMHLTALPPVATYKSKPTSQISQNILIHIHYRVKVTLKFGLSVPNFMRAIGVRVRRTVLPSFPTTRLSYATSVKIRSAQRLEAGSCCV
jgi:hypothetical protein